jgi:hypothetical protein
MGRMVIRHFLLPPTLLAKMESMEPEWHGRVTQIRRAPTTVKDPFQSAVNGWRSRDHNLVRPAQSAQQNNILADQDIGLVHVPLQVAVPSQGIH